MLATISPYYESTNYGDLNHIHETTEWPYEDMAHAVLKQMKDAGACEMFGVCRLHKHFELNAGECVVTTLGENGFISSVHSYKANYIPRIWKFNKAETKWMPTEFIELPQHIASQSEVLKQIEQASEMMASVAQLFSMFDGVDFTQIGLCIDISKIFQLIVPKGYCMGESTKEDERQQQTILHNLNDERYKMEAITKWFMNAEDDSLKRIRIEGCAEALWGAH